MKQKLDKKTSAYFILFIVVMVILCKPFTHASATSATPYVVAGTRHTVGLKSDGMVVATGLNENGQCNVSSWRNIVQIAAGGYFTVGLKSDGTVVAAGSESIRQIKRQHLGEYHSSGRQQISYGGPQVGWLGCGGGSE